MIYMKPDENYDKKNNSIVRLGECFFLQCWVETHFGLLSFLKLDTRITIVKSVLRLPYKTGLSIFYYYLHQYSDIL